MMGRLLVLIGIVSVVLLGPGCGGDSDEPTAPAETEDQKQWKVAQATIDGNQEMADSLKGIKDVESAKAAVPKLQAAIDAMNEAVKKMDTMGELSDAITKRIDEEFTPALEKSQAVINAEMERLSEMPDVMEVIAPVLASMMEE